MMKSIPELPFDIEGTEEEIRSILKLVGNRDVERFDAILRHYLDEIATLKNKIEWYRSLDNRPVWRT